MGELVSDQEFALSSSRSLHGILEFAQLVSGFSDFSALVQLAQSCWEEEGWTLPLQTLLLQLNLLLLIGNRIANT